MLTFDELALSRRLLQDFCTLHVQSLLFFRSGTGFKRDSNEDPLDPNEVKHITSTITCLESLLDCPDRFLGNEGIDPKALVQEFASLAIELPADRWKSDESAQIYCRCRALPLITQHLREFNPKLKEHVDRIFSQVINDNRFAIGEADPDIPSSDWYPPNAFHTYWTLELIDSLEERFKSESFFAQQFPPLELNRRRAEMMLWVRSTLGYQVALHSAESSALDSDQLAWALATIMRFGENFQSNLADQDLIKQALKCLFKTQTDVGTWRRYQPLFHYRKSGNAYCYVYETFTVLLKASLTRRGEGEFLREALKPFLTNLIRLLNYAKSTQIPLSSTEKKIGWCSGHTTNRLYPESWATASVFSYAQGLRRLIGIWAREEALRYLNPVRVTLSSPPDAQKKLIRRGDTWHSSNISVAEQLLAMFVNPVRMAGSPNMLEPDSPPIETRQSRSAILFGPPGTSKTTLARSVAGAIGWEYVELHASHFVAEGLPNVQRMADNLFQKLMELDHAVVLFDEIDELVREREEIDTFGRFLTNSMLPKLAQLWEQRKVIYFIATNHIEYFDRAVTRSQRFDALILVGPPSFDAKVARLKKLLKRSHAGTDIRFEFSKEDIEKALVSIKCNKKDKTVPVPRKHVLAKFALLRWDQMDELNQYLNIGRQPGNVTVTNNDLENVLCQIRDRRLGLTQPYCEYKSDPSYIRRDYSKVNVWLAKGLSGEVPNIPFIEKKAGSFWIVTETEVPESLTIPGYRLRRSEPGVVECEPLVSS